ncbi:MULTISPECIES: LacI family DNA-binding transcriptional regulator [Luteimonas]|uniref:LacI family DNA-binding transcriptional regulator n=1 Tax=Luteimonas TaxID=83614 RepID=UPI000C799206|nr:MULTISPECIES: LacI family DNA-binding transcriptional regulator [Luteimonas]
MSITIKDVAQRANVSVATVSRALNGHQNVAEAVRKRVLAVAAELRYSPHHAARSLSSRRTQTIGVVLPDLHGEFFSELMRGIDQVARVRGQHLLVSSYHGNPEAQGAALRAMRGRVDGLLLMSPYLHDADFLSQNVDASLPLVLMNAARSEGHAALGIDNHGGALAMTRHLIAAGYRRIAFIAGPEDNDDARERLRGYRDGLDEAGAGLEPWVLPGRFDEDSGHQAGQALLAADARPDAIFAANDMMAIGCLYALGRGGLKTPDEVAVVGFDDIPLARYVHPALTTMRVDIAELGARAIKTLLDIEAAPAASVPGAMSLQTELVVRDSCGSRRSGSLSTVSTSRPAERGATVMR